MNGNFTNCTEINSVQFVKFPCNELIFLMGLCRVKTAPTVVHVRSCCCKIISRGNLQLELTIDIDWYWLTSLLLLNSSSCSRSSCCCCRSNSSSSSSSSSIIIVVVVIVELVVVVVVIVVVVVVIVEVLELEVTSRNGSNDDSVTDVSVINISMLLV